MPDPTQTRRLNKSGLEFTQLGFGAATQGGLYRAVSEEDVTAAFDYFWGQDIRYVDTAPWYGWGQSEERLGRFLQGKNGYVLSSKVGRVLGEDFPVHATQLDERGEKVFKNDSRLNAIYDFSYDGIMRSFESSLERLQTDHIDILFIHDPDYVGTTVDQVFQRGGYKALVELREQKAIRAFGAGMNQWEMPLEFAQKGDFDVFLLAGRYTLLEQSSMEFMDHCAHHGIGVVIGGVYNSGLLANPTSSAHYNYATVPKAVLQHAQHLQEICQEHGIPLKAAAIQFPLAHPAVVSVLMAGRSVEQLKESLEAFQTPIPAELWQSLKQEGLLTEDIPVPS